jgi:hypothetical protein
MHIKLVSRIPRIKHTRRISPYAPVTLFTIPGTCHFFFSVTIPISALTLSPPNPVYFLHMLISGQNPDHDLDLASSASCVYGGHFLALKTHSKEDRC